MIAFIMWVAIAGVGVAGLSLSDLIQPCAHYKLCCLLWCAWPVVMAVAIGCLLWVFWGDLALSTVNRRKRWDYF